MKAIKVPLLPHFNKNSALDDIAKALDATEAHKIAIAPWPVFGYNPDVFFKMAYSEDCLLLKYVVIESEIRIVYHRNNDPVYKDSCVEFFISFGADKAYYNFEFNCIGTCLAAFGENRANRMFLPAASIDQIQSSTQLQTKYNSNFQKLIFWSITLKIPNTVFSHHQFTSLKNLQCRGNFYKCGDNLNTPHFLTWNPIMAPNPDFHLSAFFGSIEFS